jgi:hypothetical protein
MSLEHVTKITSDYSTEERTHFREVFAPKAERFRQYSRRALATALGAVIVWFFAIMFLPRVGLFWVCGVLMIVFLGMFVYGLYTRPPLECPACRNLLDSWNLGCYCPECGSDQLKKGGLLQPPSCGACSKTMYRRKGGGYKYKIRACTYCGVFLDDRGV